MHFFGYFQAFDEVLSLCFLNIFLFISGNILKYINIFFSWTFLNFSKYERKFKVKMLPAKLTRPPPPPSKLQLGFNQQSTPDTTASMITSRISSMGSVPVCPCCREKQLMDPVQPQQATEAPEG